MEDKSEPPRRRVAAIDCGTNSLRLLVADVDPGRAELTDVRRCMEIVRLGQGVDATGRLAPQALERTFAVLADYARTIASSGAEGVRLVATSATRDASNASEFAAGVRRILGVEPEVITGTQEAVLSFTGATAELSRKDLRPSAPEPPFLVADIGGGSTEFVIGGGGLDLAAISVNIGCVRMTERHLRDDPPASSQIAATVADIDRALADVDAALRVGAARTLVGVAGSVTTLTAIALGLSDYEPDKIHHARISMDQVREVTARLLATDHAGRARIRAIHPGRVDVIAAGALVLERIMVRFGFADLVTSEHDILDGIAWSIAERAAGDGARGAR